MCTKAKCYATSRPVADAVDLVQSSEVLVIIAFGLTKKIFFSPQERDSKNIKGYTKVLLLMKSQAAL